jgi:hypothetical protein
MVLGNGVFMKYILREPNDGSVRFLGTGRIERDGLHGLSVYDGANTLRHDLTGTTIRSWNVLGPNGRSIDNDIEVQDLERLG